MINIKAKFSNTAQLAEVIQFDSMSLAGFLLIFTIQPHLKQCSGVKKTGDKKNRFSHPNESSFGFYYTK